MYREYGSVILKEGSILYHASVNNFSYTNSVDKPLLFCSFHPSEFLINRNYIHIHHIKLKKNVRLFFMIDSIKQRKIHSSFDNFINSKNKNKKFLKLNQNKRIMMAQLLKNENFNGWFSSIDRGSTLEVALLNDTSLFECIKSERYVDNTNQNFYINENTELSNMLNENIMSKVWGKHYKICVLIYPVNLYLNIKYKEMIDTFMKDCIKVKNTYNNILFLLLQNAFIKYHHSNNTSNINQVNHL